MNNRTYLNVLSENYPNIQSASSEIINLKAIMSLPKGTEHFISDIHGEFEEFSHIIKNGSGVIKRKINDLFEDSISDYEKRQLATIIYYPEQTLELINRKELTYDWYKQTLERLIKVCRLIASKYTRSKVRKALPKEYAYIIEELLHEQEHKQDKERYYHEIINTIIETNQAKRFVIAISTLIQHLSIDHIHIVGDIFDRGPNADKVIEKLMEHQSIDIQFGNHDILWMGAFQGSEICVANTIRLALRHNNIKTIEDAYSIPLTALKTFANQAYKGDLALEFDSSKGLSTTLRRMHKAITIIQLKLEQQIIKRHPEFEMDDRLLLNQINYDDFTIIVNGKKHQLTTTFLPTLDKKSVYKLTNDEEEVITALINHFRTSSKLAKHIDFLYQKGDLYTIYNSNILIHGCIPLKEDKQYSSLLIDDKEYSGQALLDRLDALVKECYYQNIDHLDYFFYLWQGPKSPLFGRNKMTTFERYFISDKSTWKEDKNAYFDFRDNQEIIYQIIEDFGLEKEKSHIINGHQPVRVSAGEDPVKAGGKVIVIDGGFSEAYHPVTGIKGYTLISNSYGLLLVEHQDFHSTQHAIAHYEDIVSEGRILKVNNIRTLVSETDNGLEIAQKIKALSELVKHYQSGKIRQK